METKDLNCKTRSIDNTMNNYQAFVSLHQGQLLTSGVPSNLWKSLYRKLRNGIFDAGDHFQIAKVMYEEDDEEADSGPLDSAAYTWKVVVINQEISLSNRHHIYLIDHAWTYRIDTARSHLQQIPRLLQRMAEMMEIPVAGEDQEFVIECVLKEMWKYNQTYSIKSSLTDIESTMPVWYIMDEFGSRIQHSDNPSFRTVPFYYMFGGLSYTLLFPVQDLNVGDEVTRNFIEGPPADLLTQTALKIPWFPTDMTNVDFNPSEPGSDFFSSFKQNETLPVHSNSLPLLEKPTGKLKVFTEYGPIALYLKHPAFEITHTVAEADILWYTTHFKNFRELSEHSPHKYVNQFPFECVLTIKDLLSVVCRSVAKDEFVNPSSLETSPRWLPTTYNLTTELPQLVSYFQHREKRGLDNHWICKPWNLARGLDTHITNNLHCLTRLPASGPKIACKYIEDPVLFQHDEIDGPVKFDIRYIVLLSSISPLRIFVYERFWLRFANKPFSLDHLDDYDKHFTVMNYRPVHLKQMFCEDFIHLFEKQYPNFKYEVIEQEIFSMLKEVFDAAAHHPPPRGIGTSAQSRAMYGMDIMLKWVSDTDGTKRIQPMLLEINWAPDCQRACQYYPDFFDDVFSVLFLDESEGKHVQLL